MYLVNRIPDYPCDFIPSVYLCAWHADSHGSRRPSALSTGRTCCYVVVSRDLRTCQSFASPSLPFQGPDKSVALMASKSVRLVRPFPSGSTSVLALHSYVVNSIRYCRLPLTEPKLHDRYLGINWFRSACVYLLEYNVNNSQHTLLLDCNRCTLREFAALSEVRHPLVRSTYVPRNEDCISKSNWLFVEDFIFLSLP